MVKIIFDGPGPGRSAEPQNWLEAITMAIPLAASIKIRLQYAELLGEDASALLREIKEAQARLIQYDESTKLPKLELEKLCSDVLTLRQIDDLFRGMWELAMDAVRIQTEELFKDIIVVQVLSIEIGQELEKALTEPVNFKFFRGHLRGKLQFGPLKMQNNAALLVLYASMASTGDRPTGIGERNFEAIQAYLNALLIQFDLDVDQVICSPGAMERIRQINSDSL